MLGKIQKTKSKGKREPGKSGVMFSPLLAAEPVLRDITRCSARTDFGSLLSFHRISMASYRFYARYENPVAHRSPSSAGRVKLYLNRPIARHRGRASWKRLRVALPRVLSRDVAFGSENAEPTASSPKNGTHAGLAFTYWTTEVASDDSGMAGEIADISTPPRIASRCTCKRSR